MYNKELPLFLNLSSLFILEVMYAKMYQKEYCYHALNISTNLNAFKKFYYVKQIHIQIFVHAPKRRMRYQAGVRDFMYIGVQ